MALSNCVVLACGISISLNAALVKGENKTNNQSDPDDFIESNNHGSQMLKGAFAKEFNSIMSHKNARIESLKNELKRVDQLINSNNDNESFSVEENVTICTLQATNKMANESTIKSSNTWELKDFVKRRLRSAFQKELCDIIKEKSCQIYLLEELLSEKRKSLALQRRLQDKRNNRTVQRVTYGPGEPSMWEY